MNVELLNRVRDPQHRDVICADLHHVRIDGSMWTGAVSSERILLLAGGDGDDSPSADRIITILGRVSPCAWRTDMADLRAWAGQDGWRCTKCSGTGRRGAAQECSRCGGEGTVECDLGEDHDCPACDGKGNITPDCNACGGAGHRGYILGTLSTHRDIALNRLLLGDVIHDLPGESVQVAITGPDTAVEFRGPGWRLLVAPLTGRGADAEALALTPIDAAREIEHPPLAGAP